MKLGVEDISIGYEIPPTGPAKKKKFVRRTLTSSENQPASIINRNNNISGGHASRMNINNRPPMIGTGINNNYRPPSAVRFQEGHAPKAKPATTPTPSRPPQSPASSKKLSTQVPESPIHARPVTPNRQVTTYGEEPRFPITSFRQEYQSITPIPTITRVRKEHVYRDVPVPWNKSCNPPDRDTLRVAEDMAKNLRRQKVAMAKNMGVRPGSAPVGHKKTIPGSFSRNRNSRTSGPILNLPYSELHPNCPPVEKNIHDKRWNIQTKDRDDEERAKPEGGRDTSLHAMYLAEKAYYRRNRPKTGGAIRKTDEFSDLFHR